MPVPAYILTMQLRQLVLYGLMVLLPTCLFMVLKLSKSVEVSKRALAAPISRLARTIALGADDRGIGEVAATEDTFRRESMTLSYATLRHFLPPPNKDLHKERHFPSSHNFSALNKYLPSAGNTSLPHSLNPNLLLRSMFQQRKMTKFCSENRFMPRIPSTTRELDTLLQHLLYDDSKRIIYCYVPKNGCSYMKHTFLILNGSLPPKSVAKRPPETILKKVKSFTRLSTKEALYRLENYLKFVIVRNPLERLLSAYRNKLESPLQLKYKAMFPDKWKAYILKHYRQVEFMQWLKSNTSTEIFPKFEEFAKFMTRFPLSRYNEHFMPVLNLCYPCAVQYDLYLNFKILDYDVFALMDYLDIPKSYYPRKFLHRYAPTAMYMSEYFSNLSRDTRKQLLHVFAKELRFYYELYPEERSMH